MIEIIRRHPLWIVSNAICNTFVKKMDVGLDRNQV